jgi:hypothetical protein
MVQILESTVVRKKILQITSFSDEIAATILKSGK